MKLGIHSTVSSDYLHRYFRQFSRGSSVREPLNYMYVCVPSYSSSTMGTGVRHRQLVTHHQKHGKSYFNILPETISTCGIPDRYQHNVWCILLRTVHRLLSSVHILVRPGCRQTRRTLFNWLGSWGWGGLVPVGSHGTEADWETLPKWLKISGGNWQSCSSSCFESLL
jgi:hypothetical protein